MAWQVEGAAAADGDGDGSSSWAGGLQDETQRCAGPAQDRVLHLARGPAGDLCVECMRAHAYTFMSTIKQHSL